jgi:hypothetical protein
MSQYPPHLSSQPGARLQRGSASSQHSLHSRSSSTGSLASTEAAAMRLAAMQALAGAGAPPATHAAHAAAAPPPAAAQPPHSRSLSAPPSPQLLRAAPPPQLAPPPPPLPPVADSPEDSPDLERFLQAAAPQVPHPAAPEALAELSLAEVWACYEAPSLYGLECPTLGGPRGPSTAHFVPYLSAVQLFEVAQEPQGGADPAAAAGAAREDGGGAGGGEVLVYPPGLDTWPGAMRRCLSWAASEHVGDRSPLHQRVGEVCGGAGGAHPLAATRLRRLHPYSWFSVAWYPLYRIPEAPLAARFLTFHSLAPLWEAAAAAQRQLEAAQRAAAQERQAAAAAAATAAAASEAAPAAAAFTAAAAAPPPSRPSYKSMLAAGRAASAPPALPRGAGAATPTGVCSFPASPSPSEGGTRSNSQGAASSSSAPPTASDSSSLAASHGSSLAPSPEGSDDGDDRAAPPPGLGPAPDASAPPLALPAVGLCWHAAAGAQGRAAAAAENWTDTLVAMESAGTGAGTCRGLRPGAALPGGCGARVEGVWGRVAVVRKDYPVAKGGPMSWEVSPWTWKCTPKAAACAARRAHRSPRLGPRPPRSPPPPPPLCALQIQLEELEEGARRLALGQGLLCAGPADPRPASPACACPDYEFFASRRRR